MGSQEVIHRTALSMGGKRQSSKALHRTNESKELEATLNIQESDLGFNMKGVDHKIPRVREMLVLGSLL